MYIYIMYVYLYIIYIIYVLWCDCFDLLTMSCWLHLGPLKTNQHNSSRSVFSHPPWPSSMSLAQRIHCIKDSKNKTISTSCYETSTTIWKLITWICLFPSIQSCNPSGAVALLSCKTTGWLSLFDILKNSTTSRGWLFDPIIGRYGEQKLRWCHHPKKTLMLASQGAIGVNKLKCHCSQTWTY